MTNNYPKPNKNVGKPQKMIYDFLYDFLPGQKGSSPHTVRSYEQALNSYLSYISEEKKKDICKITFNDFSREDITNYLNSLTEAKLADSTRNQRRASICSFLSYAATICPTLEWQYLRAHKVPIKRECMRFAEEALSVEELNLLFEQIQKNPDTKRRYRDRAIVMMLYDTAARVAELLEIRLKDLVLGRKDPYVLLRGKGGKIRRIGVSNETLAVLDDYAKAYEINLASYGDDPLFYSNHHSVKLPMHTDTIRRMLKRYEEQMRKVGPSFNKSLHPHLLRATRATHLLSQGIDIFIISKFLGHADITTTEKYLRINMDQINKALQHSAEDETNPLRAFLDPKYNKGKQQKRKPNKNK